MPGSIYIIISRSLSLLPSVCANTSCVSEPYLLLHFSMNLKIKHIFGMAWHWGCFKTIWVQIGSQTKKFLPCRLLLTLCLFVRLSVTGSVCHTVCLSHGLSVTSSVCHTLDTSHSRRARETPPKAAILRVFSNDRSTYFKKKNIICSTEFDIPSSNF